MDQVFETISVKYFFTDKEKLDIAGDLVKKVDEKSVIETEFDDVKKSFKELIDRHQNKVDSLLSLLRDGYEWTEKECILKFDFDKKKRLYVNPESGAVEKETDLRDLDYQTDAFKEYNKSA